LRAAALHDNDEGEVFDQMLDERDGSVARW
jgi:hypothetical protein